MTSIERYVGQSTIADIYAPRWSQIGSSKEIVGECKYCTLPLSLQTLGGGGGGTEGEHTKKKKTLQYEYVLGYVHTCKVDPDETNL